METIRQISLKELLLILYKRFAVIFLTALVAMCSAFLSIGCFTTPKYESTASLYLGNSGEELDYTLALKLISDCRYLLKSNSVLEQVLTELKIDRSIDELRDQIAINNPEGTRILEITVKCGNPTQAKEIADKLCDLGGTKIKKTIGFRQVALHEAGTLEPEPCNRPGLVLYLLIAIMAAVTAYSVYILIYLMDPRLHSAAELEQKLQLPILTEIPATSVNDTEDKEIYHKLRSNFTFLGKEKKIFAIISCGIKTARSSIAVNLAEDLAGLGREVLLIDGDFRTNAESRSERYINPKGLSEVLNGQCLLDQVLNPRKNGRVQFILSGETPEDPSGLLGGNAFRALLESARFEYDYILIDTAPMGQYIDAAVAASECDGIILCVGEQPWPQIKEAVEQLQRSGCPIIGFIWQQGMK